MKQVLALVSFNGSHNAQPGGLAAAKRFEVGANRKHLLKVAEVSAGIALAIPLALQFYAVRELLAAFILFTVACTLLGLLGVIVVLMDVGGELLLDKLWSSASAWIAFANRGASSRRDGQSRIKKHEVATLSANCNKTSSQAGGNDNED
jgi:hypothetical protein